MISKHSDMQDKCCGAHFRTLTHLGSFAFAILTVDVAECNVLWSQDMHCDLHAYYVMTKQVI